MGLSYDRKRQDSLEELRGEVTELRDARRRLVLSADADRRVLERELHDGVQQQLVALAMRLQLAIQAADEGAPTLRPLLDEMAGDVQRALDEASALAEGIYLSRLETGSLASALRRAASRAGVDATVDVRMTRQYPAAVARHVYSCCRVALEGTGPGARTALTVRERGDAIVFELEEDGEHSQRASDEAVQRLRDRVEALGGSVTVAPNGSGRRISCALPVTA